MISPNQVSRVAGLFGGMGATPDPAVPADPRQRTAMQQMGVTNPLLQQFGQSVAGLFGKADQMASPMQQMNRAIQSVKDPSSYEGKLKIAQAVMQIDPMQGTQLLAAAEEEQAKLKRREAAVSSNLARARSFDVPEETINAYKNGGLTDEQLNDTVKDFRDRKFSAEADRLKKAQKIKVQLDRATSAGAPVEVLDDIRSGQYTGENGTDNLMKVIQGEDTDNAEFMDVTSGRSAGYFPYRNGKILVKKGDQNVWMYPQEYNENIVPAQTRTQTGTDSRSFGRPTQGQAFTLAAADSLTTSMINDIEGSSQGDLLTVFGLSQAGIPTDSSSLVTQYNEVSREALLRLASGAAIPETEVERFKKFLTLTAKDAFSPVTVARKLRFAKTMLNLNSRFSFGDLGEEEVLPLMKAALSADFSDEEKALLSKGKYATVIGNYTDLSGKKKQPALSASAAKYVRK